jgi:MFS family permease
LGNLPPRITLPVLWDRLKEGTSLATAGGSWARAVSINTQKNLRWFFFDGILSAGQDGIIGTYLSLYLLFLGATSGQIGLLSALTSLGATLMLLPGAMLSDRFGNRKLIVLLCGGGVTRVMILLMAITPFFLHGPAAIFFIIALKVIADGSANMSLPAWTSMVGDIVPLAWRGRYFGSKNLFMAISGVAAMYLIGNLITHNATLSGYQMAIGIAFLFGGLATFSFSRISEPIITGDAAKQPQYSLRAMIQTLNEDRDFLVYIGFGMIWSLAINVVGPFFNVYMIQGLKGTANDVGLFQIAGSLAALPALGFFGRLSDRYGPRKVMLWTGYTIPFIPLVWAFTTLPVQGVLINIPAGLIWGGFNLAAFNFLLVLAPSAKRARYTALYQIAVALSAAAGAALGGVVVTHFGYPPIFIISTIGRFVGIIIFARFVHQRTEG